MPSCAMCIEQICKEHVDELDIIGYETIKIKYHKQGGILVHFINAHSTYLLGRKSHQAQTSRHREKIFKAERKNLCVT